MSVLLKNPSDSIDYQMQWSNIGSATLLTVAHSVPSDLTLVAESNTTSTSTVRVSGGTHGRTYTVVASASLSTGRTLVRTFPLRLVKH